MIVVADTSIFLNLGVIRQENLLQSLYTEVLAPPEVEHEFVSACSRYPRFDGLSFPPWVLVQRSQNLLSAIAPGVRLDPGESAAIALAAEIRADLILIDEANGRAVARQLGLRASGLLAVLLDAKAVGILPSVASLIDELEAKAQFWLSAETKRLVLKMAGELS